MKKLRRSPLFYVGDKYKLLNELIDSFPKEIDRFIEPFTGGGSVFLNINANEYLLNDIDTNVIDIHKLLLSYVGKEKTFIDNIEEKVHKYGFSYSYKKDVVPLALKKEFKKTYYAKFNKVPFESLKNDYNSSSIREVLDLYILLIYGFNRMLRFNSSGAYNIPVGNVDFNKNVVNALVGYFEFVREKSISLSNIDYKDFLSNITFKIGDFVYVDPPYLITFSEYNKLWNTEKEQELLNYLDHLNSLKVKFALSNVVRYKGKENSILLSWIKNYSVKRIKSNYISYHDNTIKSFEEVLITNF